MIHRIRPVALRRSWLFLAGSEREHLLSATTSGADVLIDEQEDLVAPARREQARMLIREVIAAWRAAGVVTAVRINPLWDGGVDDLAAALAAAPDVILVPKVSEPSYVVEVDQAIARCESEYGLPPGVTELVPNIESARGLMQTYAIARASDRVTACLISSGDMAASLGAGADQDGPALAFARARFHLECVAAGAVSIDCPYNRRDEAGLIAQARHARGLGYSAKSALIPAHVAVINRTFTPVPAEIARAHEVIAAFEAAQSQGQGSADLGDEMAGLPDYLSARRLLERAAALAEIEAEQAEGTAE